MEAQAVLLNPLISPLFSLQWALLIALVNQYILSVEYRLCNVYVSPHYHIYKYYQILGKKKHICTIQHMYTSLHLTISAGWMGGFNDTARLKQSFYLMMFCIMTKCLTIWPPVYTSVSLFLCDVNGRWPAYFSQRQAFIYFQSYNEWTNMTCKDVSQTKEYVSSHRKHICSWELVWY